MAGGGPYLGNVLWNATKLVTQKAYWALSSQGYHSDQIRYFSDEEFIDMNSDGVNDRAGEATKANFQDALENWARAAVPGTTSQPPEEILIFMSGHGGNGSFQICVDDPLMADTLDGWMDALQTATSCDIIFIYDACLSGSFFSELLPPEGSAVHRYTIASASDDQRAWFLNSGKHSFSYHFWDAVYTKGHLYEAFAEGKNFMKFEQSPVLDLTGDGKADAVTKVLLASDIQIGRGRVAASTPPSIGEVYLSRDTLACETSTTVTATGVTTLNGISSVMARVVRFESPDEQVDKTKPGVFSPASDHLDGTGEGPYENTFDDFVEDGVYGITVTAEDKSGTQSIPVTRSLVRGCDSESPLIVTGDVNGDRTVDLDDMMVALKLMVGIVTDQIRLDYVISGVDVNGNDKAGFEEVIYALREAAGL